ncbi:MAG: hypothetical protein HC872_00325 [Gammaproteobacteria bacterium]|nr:hypothetical protein [Gammaproteobacteria bacterium]
MMSLFGLLINGSLIGVAVFVVGWISVTALKVGGPERFERTWRRVMQLIIGFVLFMVGGCIVVWLTSTLTGQGWFVRPRPSAGIAAPAADGAALSASEPPA